LYWLVLMELQPPRATAKSVAGRACVASLRSRTTRIGSVKRNLSNSISPSAITVTWVLSPFGSTVMSVTL